MESNCKIHYSKLHSLFDRMNLTINRIFFGLQNNQFHQFHIFIATVPPSFKLSLIEELEDSCCHRELKFDLSMSMSSKILKPLETSPKILGPLSKILIKL